MRALMQMLNRPIGTQVTDARLGQVASNLAAIIVFVVGVRKVIGLELSEAGTLAGLLLVLIASLLLACFGMLTYLVTVHQKGSSPPRG